MISTVNIQHLESLNDAIFELTDVRVRETFPDRVLEEADEVVLVDLTPEALQERLRAGKVYPPDRVDVALDQLLPRSTSWSALRELALREVAEDVGARRQAAVLDPLSQQAVAERVLALVTPEPRSQRILRRAWRSAERLGAEMDALWVRPPGRELNERGADRSSRRCAGSRVVLGAHFLEEEGDDLVATVRRVVARARLDLRASSARRREPAPRDLPRVAGLGARARAAGRRHPRRRQPRGSRGAGRDRRRVIAARSPRARGRARRSLVRRPPPAARAYDGKRADARAVHRRRLDPTVLDAAIRIARAEDAMLVPAYLLVVPLEYCRGLAAEGAGRGRDAAARGGRARGARAPACPSMRASRRAARRRTRSGASGRSSASTASSPRRDGASPRRS